MNVTSLIKYRYVIALLISVFLIGSLSAQSTESSFDMSDVLLIESPSSKFKSIYLQSHKGLPRFGAQNIYLRIGNQPIEDVKANHSKKKLLEKGHLNYFNLLAMKYFSAYYDDIDPEYLTVLTRENKDNKKDIHSVTAQQKLLPLASNISSETLFRAYFCDEKTNPNCIYPSGQWGGSRDDFVIQEKYAAYVKDNLKELRAWSKSLFNEDKQTAYWVQKYSFNPYGNSTIPYDFEQNGYWMDMFPSSTGLRKGLSLYPGGYEAFFFEFLPETNYGNAHLNRMNDPNDYWPKMLLKINPAEAEALANRKTKDLYAAIKVTIVYKELEESQPTFARAVYTYHLADPIIEFYEDVELTQKLGEISLENPTYKSNKD